MPAGLQSVFVRALVIDPTAPSLIYAGTGSGVFRSTDGASSWLDASAGLSGAAVYALALDPNAPRTLYAGTSAGVFKSNDFGAFWTPMNAGLTASRVSALALDPIATGTVYAGTDAGVFRSTDAGSSWQALNDGLTDLQVWSLAVDPGSSTVYAGTATSGVFRLASGGSADSSALNTLAGPLVLTSSTGAFWFFDSDNIELVVKVLDGRSVNGKFWVFYGALSNVEYTITVTDTLTGAVKTYFNPQGQLASVADTAGFSGASRETVPSCSCQALDGVCSPPDGVPRRGLCSSRRRLVDPNGSGQSGRSRDGCLLEHAALLLCGHIC